MEWKKVLILVTAFTIGHSLTLALSIYNIIRIKSELVEVLIPITIICNCVYNIFSNNTSRYIRFNYAIALCFGFIHGMGFANTIRFMMASDQTLLIPLTGFNLGLEAGQVLFVSLILLLTFLILKIKFNFRWWTLIITGIVLCTSIWMVMERWPMLNNNR